MALDPARKRTSKAAPEPTPETAPAATRTSKYAPSLCEAVVAFMGLGFSLTAFAGEIGVSRETLLRWRRRYPAFNAAVKIAEAARARALEKKLLDANSGASVSAHVFALKCAVPEEWRDKAAPAADGEGGKPVKLELAIRFV